MDRKKIWIIMMALLAVVFVVSLGMTVYNQVQYQQAAADAEEAAQLVGLQPGTQSKPPEASRPASAPPEGTKPQPDGAGHPSGAQPGESMPPEQLRPPEWYLLPEEARELAGLNLSALRAYNADVVGWISIPGTVLSYPLVQGPNNDYYLNRSWKKGYNPSGSVFLSSDSSRDLTDFHTIVYGHRMLNLTMFGSIKYYSSANYWREHPSVYIVLDDTICRYDIFAAHEVAVNGIVYRLDLEKNHLEEEFLHYCTSHSVLKTGLTPKAGDRILTLSTCTSTSSETSRWVVHGVLAREYKRTNF